MDPDTSGMLRFLVDELVSSESIDQRVWIIGHVPTGGLTHEALPVAGAVFTQIVERFTDIIAGIFFGHTHRDEFSILYAGDGSAKSAQNALNVAWIMQSITPWLDYNPGWRYYTVDSGTFEIMDSVNYYARLNDSFNDEMQWQFEYSPRSYDTSWPLNAPLNATFWHNVAEKIKHNASFAQQYVDRSWRFSPYTPNCKSETCRYENYCYTTSMNADQAIKCRGEFGLSLTQIDSIPRFPMPRPHRDAH